MKKCISLSLTYFIVGGLLGFSYMVFGVEKSPDRDEVLETLLEERDEQSPYAYKLGCQINTTEDWKNFQPEQEFLFVVSGVPQPEICGTSYEECHEKSDIPSSFYACIEDGVCVHFPRLVAEYCVPVTSADPEYEIDIWVNLVSGLSRNKTLKERFGHLSLIEYDWVLELWMREKNEDSLQFTNGGTPLPKNSATIAFVHYSHYNQKDQRILTASYSMECVAQPANRAEVKEALNSGSPQVVRHGEGLEVNLCK